MYLLNVKTHELERKADGDVIPRYGILSHTWRQHEITFRDMTNTSLGKLQRLPGYGKLKFVFEMAERQSLEYVWVDTCCIDKQSSSELSEAINSMYRYYQQAVICWVLLSDLSPRCPELRECDRDINAEYHQSFVKCRWFTRGWTLQELLAPDRLIFYGPRANVIGSRSDLIHDISKATNIDILVLQGKRPLHSISIAKRMSWAAKRRTTRSEDRAYSLLGIFGVNMPMLYGEGENAFARLQEEILRSSNDHSIFAWDPSNVEHEGRLLASSPDRFSDSQRIVGFPGTNASNSYRLANGGLEIELPVYPHSEYKGGFALLNCGYEYALDSVLCLSLAGYFRDILGHPGTRLTCSVPAVSAARLGERRMTDTATWEPMKLWISLHQKPLSISPETLVIWIKPRIHSAQQFGSEVLWDDRASVLEIVNRNSCGGAAFEPVAGLTVLLVIGRHDGQPYHLELITWSSNPGEEAICRQWNIEAGALGRRDKPKFEPSVQRKMPLRLDRHSPTHVEGSLEMQKLRGRWTLIIEFEEQRTVSYEDKHTERAAMLRTGNMFAGTRR